MYVDEYFDALPDCIRSGTSLKSLLDTVQRTDGFTLSQVCAFTGLEGSTVQNWVKRGFVAHPENKKYRERQIARILIISALRDALGIDGIVSLMSYVNGDVEDEADDIVSEAKLLGYFTAALSSVGNDEISIAVRKVTSDFGKDTEAGTRLCNALAVMVTAAQAAVLKKRAERQLEQIKISGNNKNI